MPGMIGGSAPTALSQYDPSQMSRQEKLMMIGAMLHDTGNSLRGSGDADSAMNLKMLLAQQQLARQGMGLIGGMFGQGGQGVQIPQLPAGDAGATAPDPQQAPPGPDDLHAALGSAIQRLSPAPATAAAVPAMTPPMAPRSSGSMPSLRDPQTVQKLAYMKALGLPGDLIEKALVDGQPAVKYDRGVGYDEKTGLQMGRYHPDVSPDRQPVFDANGNVIGEQMLQGADTAAGRIEGAKTNATEAAKAAYDLIPVPQGDGSTRLMSRSQALAMATGQGGGPSGGGGPDGGGGVPGAFGVTPTPAMTTLSNKRAETQATREQLQPKEAGAMADLKRTSDLTSQIIHQVLGDAPVVDPKTGQTTGWKVGAGKPMLNWATTGFAANFKGVDGTPAHDLEQQLEHVKSMTALDELQKMRDNSPTGGAMGRVTDGMIDLLAATRGSIDQGQRGPQLNANLRRQLEQLDKLRAVREQTYQSEYGNVQQPDPIGQRQGAPAAAPSRAALEAEARRRGLIK